MLVRMGRSSDYKWYYVLNELVFVGVWAIFRFPGCRSRTAEKDNYTTIHGPAGTLFGCDAHQQLAAR